MRRLLVPAVLFSALSGLVWVVSCERDNYRDVLPLRPLPVDDAGVHAADLSVPPPHPDMTVTSKPDMTTAATDMTAAASDMTTASVDMTTAAPDMATLPDMATSDL